MYEKAADDPEGFWGEQAKNFAWFEAPQKVLEWNMPHAKWFVGGKLNVAYNCLDRHLEKNANKPALLWEAEDGATMQFTYVELHERVCRFANVLLSLGVKPGDCVAIYMPMVPELPIAMLACARIGAVHSVVFGGFSAMALADRIADAKSKILITADGGFRRGKIVPLKETADVALKNCPTIEKSIVVRRTEGKSRLERRPRSLVARARGKSSQGMPRAHSIPSIRSTSSTPAAPPENRKACCTHPPATCCSAVEHAAGVRSAGRRRLLVHRRHRLGHRTQLHRLRPAVERREHRDVRRRAGFSAERSLLGHHRALQGLDLLQLRHRRARVHGLGHGVDRDTRPQQPATAGHRRRADQSRGVEMVFRGHRKEILPDRGYLVANGNRFDSDFSAARRDAHQTRLGHVAAARRGRESGEYAGRTREAGETGYLMIEKPWPSMLRTIYGDDERYRREYWSRIPGVYFAGDAAQCDKDGYIWVLGRVDDVIKVAGHRLSSMEIESALVSHPAVAEAAVVARPDDIKGEAIVCFVTLRAGQAPTQELRAALREHVANTIGTIARPAEVRFADMLPKTRSGKIMRRLLRELAQKGGSPATRLRWKICR